MPPPSYIPCYLPQGTGRMMPAFLVGYELEDGRGLTDDTCRLKIQERETWPAWIVEVSQQAGGVAMTYPAVLGVVLRLEANARFAIQDIQSLLLGFHAMAEDPNVGLLKRGFPALSRICGTRGASLSGNDLACLDRFLKIYYHLPPSESGIEAFVRLERANPCDYFRGWRMIEFNQGIRQIEEGCHLGTWVEEARYNREKQAFLEEIGNQFGLNEGLRIFLIWENSD